MNTDLLFTTAIRLLTTSLAWILVYYSVKSWRARRAIKQSDVADWSLVGMCLYWAFYTLYLLLRFDGDTAPYNIYLFNTRFGLLLTFTALIPLIKDRIFVSRLYEIYTDTLESLEDACSDIDDVSEKDELVA